MNHNPYHVGSWVVGTEFYNRNELLQDILTGPNRSLWIIGNEPNLLQRIVGICDQIVADQEALAPREPRCQGDQAVNLLNFRV